MVLMRKSLLSIILSGQVRYGPAGRLTPRFPDRTRVEVPLDHIGDSGESSSCYSSPHFGPGIALYPET